MRVWNSKHAGSLWIAFKNGLIHPIISPHAWKAWPNNGSSTKLHHKSLNRHEIK